MKKITAVVEDGFYEVESSCTICQSEDGDYLEFVMDEYYRKVYPDGHLGCSMNDGRIYHFMPSSDNVNVKMRFYNDNDFKYHYQIPKKELLNLPHYVESDGRLFNPFEEVYYFEGKYVWKIDIKNNKITLSKNGNKIAFDDNKHKKTLEFIKSFLKKFGINL